MICVFCGTDIKEGENQCSRCGRVYCPYCESLIPDGKNVCTLCKTPVVIKPAQAAEEECKFVCTGCGKGYSAGTRFCIECGGKVEEKKPAAPAAASSDAPKFVCNGCGKEYPAGTKFCVECGGKVEEVKPAAPVVFACAKCGKEYPEGTKFCVECGGKIEKFDPNAPEVFACVGCGKEYPEGTKFCVECGGKIESKNSRSANSNCYEEGVRRENSGDYRGALEWYQKDGSYYALCRIGHIYQKGYGNIPVNMQMALDAYRKAAALNDGTRKDGFAECYLGFFYKSGNRVPRNNAEAVKWFRISASYGNEYAQAELNRLGC